LTARIRRFGVVRTSNVVAIHTLAVLLLIFIPVALILAAVGPITTEDQFGNPVTMQPGEAIIGFAIFVFVWAGLTWVFTAIRILLYNLVAGMSGGGIEVELFQPPAPAYAPGPAWGQQAGAPSAYGSPATGQSPAGYQPPSGYQPPAYQPPAQQPPPAPQPPPAETQPRSYDPPPTTERPTYDPAPRWEAPGPAPDREDQERDRS
jgi:hypothetical protein